MRAHTITTKASTIVSGGILALGLAVVLLAATASTASADKNLDLWCAPLPTTSTPLWQIDGGCSEPVGRREGFDFGDRKVGTTSPAQGFALGIQTVNDIFIPTISVSGDYTQTNNCTTVIYSCLITVTFTPTGTGPKRGTLRTGPGGPTVALTGKGVTTPTPPVLPLTLDVYVRDPQPLKRGGVVGVVNINHARMEIGPHCHMLGCPVYDAKLVLGGDVIKTTKRFKVGAEITRRVRHRPIEARVKHLKQLRKEPTNPKITIKFTATDEFGQRVIDERKVKLCSPLVHVDRENVICRWHPSRK
jgi:hypothetical protein